jgi:hypothetical protein
MIGDDHGGIGLLHSFHGIGGCQIFDADRRNVGIAEGYRRTQQSDSRA